MMSKTNRPRLSDFPYSTTISSRWSDIDRYGHLNNTVYYVLYDAAINAYYMTHCNWDPNTHSQVGLVVSSGTDFYEIVEGFPHPITIGLAVTKLGKSSVEFEIGVFQGPNKDSGVAALSDSAKAVGKFIHVFVDRNTHKVDRDGMAVELKESLQKLVKPRALL